MSYVTEPTEKGISELNKWLSEVVPKSEVKVDKYGVAWIEIPIDKLKETLKHLKEKGYGHLTTITGTDLIDEGKMELIYHVIPYEISGYPILCIKSKIPRDNPVAPSVTDLFNIALIYEREVYDLVGIKFEGHPNLGRIFLRKDFPEGYHPLRKDFKEEGE